MSNKIIGEFENQLLADPSKALLDAVDQLWLGCIKTTGMKVFRITVLLLKR
jgi:hypothetical protein